MAASASRTMARPALLATLAGIVLLAATMVSLDQRPVELESRSEMQAQFRAAAQSARSWAAQAFGGAAASEEHVAELSPQRERAAMFHQATSLRSVQPSASEVSEHRPVVRSVRGTELSSRNVDTGSDKGFFNDALGSLGGAPPSIAQLKQQFGDASFAADAQAQLPPAPRLSSLHRSSHHTHRAEDDDDAFAAGRRQQLAEGHYGLAPEERGSVTGEAQEFGSQLQRMREQKQQQKQQQQQQRQQHVAAAKKRLLEKRKADAMGIPEGRGEGFHVTKYVSAPRTKKAEEKRREEGLSSHEADAQLMSYFSDLVKDSREKKQHRPAHKYFRARDQARQESLSEVQPAARKSRAQPVRPRDLHVSEYAAAEEALGKAPLPKLPQRKARGKGEEAAGAEAGGRGEEAHAGAGKRKQEAAKGASGGAGGGEGLAPSAKRELQARLDAAYKTIESLTKEEEKRLVKRTRSTVLRAEEKLGGLPRSRQSSALNPLANGGAKGLKDAMDDRLAERAVKASAGGSEGLEQGGGRSAGAAALRAKGMSSDEARDDLLSSMDEQFASTKEQDKIDRLRLHGMAPEAATADIMNYLSDQAKSSHEQNLKDMRHLAHPFHTDPRVQIRRQERDKSVEEEQEYESALRDALKSGPLPNKPMPTAH